MRTEVRRQITMLGNAVAAEVTGRSTHRRWIRLDPVEGRIALIEVEVPIEADATDWPKHEDEYVIVAMKVLRFPRCRAGLRAPAGVDTDSFDAIWKVDTPF